MTDTVDEAREALARLIDPVAWERTIIPMRTSSARKVAARIIAAGWLPPEPASGAQQADPDRRLKEMLFEFIRRIESGEMPQEDRAYGGVLMPGNVYAWLCLTFQEQGWSNERDRA